MRESPPSRTRLRTPPALQGFVMPRVSLPRTTPPPPRVPHLATNPPPSPAEDLWVEMWVRLTVHDMHVSLEGFHDRRCVFRLLPQKFSGSPKTVFELVFYVRVRVCKAEIIPHPLGPERGTD